MHGSDRPRRVRAGALLAGLWFVAGCNISTEGVSGNVVFTPQNCGRIGCAFDDSIGVGGVIEVVIRGAEGVSTAGVTLESGDPAVLEVVPVPDIGGRPTWELQGLDAGVARLIAVDARGEDLDFIEVGVQELSGLVLENVVGNAVGPVTTDPRYDEVWTINADDPVSFSVVPVIGAGVPTMGVYQYIATIDAEIDDGLLDRDLSEGYLFFQVPPGQFEASFENAYGHTIDVLFDALATE